MTLGKVIEVENEEQMNEEAVVEETPVQEVVPEKPSLSADDIATALVEKLKPQEAAKMTLPDNYEYMDDAQRAEWLDGYFSSKLGERTEAITSQMRELQSMAYTPQAVNEVKASIPDQYKSVPLVNQTVETIVSQFVSANPGVKLTQEIKDQAVNLAIGAAVRAGVPQDLGGQPPSGYSAKDASKASAFESFFGFKPGEKEMEVLNGGSN